jgi:hypothetical protein
MRTIYIVLALGSVSIFAASSCSDDETAAPTTATQTSNNVASSTTGNGTPTSSTGSAGGGAPMNCLECLSDIPGTCGDETAACNADAECAAWAMCFQQCFLNEGMGSPTASDQCYIDCNEMHASAAALYNASYACSCAPCSDLCGFCDLQGTGGSGTGGMGGAGGTGGQ